LRTRVLISVWPSRFRGRTRPRGGLASN
jgi:hypothetical protein